MFFQTLTNVHSVLIIVMLIQLKRHVQTPLDHSRARVILVTLGTVERVQVCTRVVVFELVVSSKLVNIIQSFIFQAN
jgi:hypothetical protein